MIDKKDTTSRFTDIGSNPQGQTHRVKPTGSNDKGSNDTAGQTTKNATKGKTT